MAEPFDSSIGLRDIDALIQTQYLPRFYETAGSRFGSTFNKIFQVNEQLAKGSGYTAQFELGPADAARAQIDPLGAIATPTALRATTLAVRWNPNSLTAHDFSQISASCQFDHWTIENGGGGAIVDLADRTFQSIMGNYNEHLAVLRNIGRNGVVALVNGTPTLNNGLHSTTGNTGAATSTATNTGGLRCKVDNGIFPALRPNCWIDFINPSTGAVRAGNVRISDKFEGDLSIGVDFVTSQFGGRVSTGDLSTVADNDQIVFSGEYNAGLYGPGAWFGTATAGESFIGGVDRTTSQYRFMIPINPRFGASTATVTKSMFDDVAIAMGYFNEGDSGAGLICQSDLTITTKLRNELGEESFKPIPQSDEKMKKFYQFGSTGLAYEHPSLGVIKILGDPLCPANVARFLNPASWMTTYYAVKGLKPLPGDQGSWYRVTASTPNTGKSLIWKTDWVAAQQDFCATPKDNAQVSNIST